MCFPLRDIFDFSHQGARDVNARDWDLSEPEVTVGQRPAVTPPVFAWISVSGACPLANILLPY